MARITTINSVNRTEKCQLFWSPYIVYIESFESFDVSELSTYCCCVPFVVRIPNTCAARASALITQKHSPKEELDRTRFFALHHLAYLRVSYADTERKLRCTKYRSRIEYDVSFFSPSSVSYRTRRTVGCISRLLILKYAFNSTRKPSCCASTAA